MLKEEFDQEYNSCRTLIEAQLDRYFALDSILAEAMRYSLLAGGKRIRPIIVLQFCKAAGGDIAQALSAACAVEMLHTYSLIHDDLPCMDNDDLRRGKPTNHIVYGECLATLSGDALQAEAFGTLLKSELPANSIVKMGKVLAKAAGLDGICLGQTLDMLNEGKDLTLDQISDIHHFKTASLLVASAQLGVIACGGSDQMLRAASMYASALGLAFQIRDDILDYTGATDILGKPAGSDEANHKTTFVTLFGIDECERLVHEKTREAIAALGGHFANTEFLEALAINLEERKC
jgi:geranylgeranyl diphosphate synthase type II